MNEFFVAMLVAGAYVLGQYIGRKWAVYRFVLAIEAGRSPKARALRAVMLDDRISQEIDR